MSLFAFRAISTTGVDESGTIDAANESIAYELLQSRGLTVFELTVGSHVPETDIPWYRRDIAFSSRELDLSTQARFAKLLASLFEAKMPVSEILRVAARATRMPSLRNLIERVSQRVSDGEELGSAFESENRVLSPIFISFLMAGSSTSDLAPTLKRLAEYLETQSSIRRKVSGALIYPAILIVAALALFCVVAFYLAPSLAPIFDAVGKPPPPTIAWLVSFRDLVSGSWLWLLLGGGVGVVALVTLAKSHRYSGLSRIRQHLPILGELSRLSVLSRLTGSAQILMQAGSSLPDALRQASQYADGSDSLVQSFATAADNLEMGLPASNAIEENSLIPAEYIELFRIGEETNQLTSILLTLTEMLTQTLEARTHRALTLLTPALTLLMGLGIGALIYTLMGALLEVNQIAF